jgi:hypothetical protein
MRLHFSPSISKKVSLGLILLLLLASSLVLFVRTKGHNPVPENIKKQLSYKVIYPAKTEQLDPTSYSYNSDGKVLSYKINHNDAVVVVTEQPAPESLGASTQAYYPALGVHPYAQFQTNLGVVALTKFYHTGSLKPFGQTGFLASHGTLLIAHSEKDLTNAEWKTLFESLKVAK